MSLNQSEIEEYIVKYICKNSEKFQHLIPHDNEKFHIVGVDKNSNKYISKPLILQGRLTDIIQHVTFELDDYLNILDQTNTSLTGRIDLYHDLYQGRSLERTFLQKKIPINYSDFYEILQHNENLTNLQNKEYFIQIIQNCEHYDKKKVENLFRFFRR